jgi:hypothetical protein
VSCNHRSVRTRTITLGTLCLQEGKGQGRGGAREEARP